MALKSIGIVGCGAIGRALLTAVRSGRLSVRIAGVTSRTEKSARELPVNLQGALRLIYRSAGVNRCF